MLSSVGVASAAGGALTGLLPTPGSLGVCVGVDWVASRARTRARRTSSEALWQRAHPKRQLG